MDALIDTIVQRPTTHVLQFRSLRGTGADLEFPCDAAGAVNLDTLPRRALCNYLCARAGIGRDFAWPVVMTLYADEHWAQQLKG